MFERARAAVCTARSERDPSVLLDLSVPSSTNLLPESISSKDFVLASLFCSALTAPSASHRMLDGRALFLFPTDVRLNRLTVLISSPGDRQSRPPRTPGSPSIKIISRLLGQVWRWNHRSHRFGIG